MQVQLVGDPESEPGEGVSSWDGGLEKSPVGGSRDRDVQRCNCTPFQNEWYDGDGQHATKQTLAILRNARRCSKWCLHRWGERHDREQTVPDSGDPQYRQGLGHAMQVNFRRFIIRTDVHDPRTSCVRSNERREYR